MKINLPSYYSNWWTKFYIVCRNLILPLSDIDYFIPKNGLIYDIGCGFGVTSLYFALSSPDRKIIGFDICQKRIRLAKLAGKNIRNLNFKIDNLIGNQHQMANTIVIIDVLHHLNHQQKKLLLSQCHHLLFSRGKLIIKEINNKPFIFFIWNYFHDLIFNFNLGSSLDFLNSKQMLNILNKYQFQVLNHHPLIRGPYSHYLYVCQKK